MDLFETLKQNLDFKKHAFTYSDSGKEKDDVDEVVLVTKSDGSDGSNNNSNNNDLVYLKKVNCFMFEKAKVSDGKQMESEDITKDLFDEHSLNCGNYRGNNSGKKLSEIVKYLTEGDKDFVGFLFRKDSDLKGYVFFRMTDDNVEVYTVCLTVLLDRKRKVAEEESLLDVLKPFL